MKKTLAKAYQDALDAVVLYPKLPTLTHKIDFLGGVKAVAGALSAPKKRTRGAPRQKGVGVRQVQLWLAHERQGQPGAPKQHRAIPPERLVEINEMINENALQATIEMIRTHGLLASLEGSLIISDKPFWRKIGSKDDPILITHQERDDFNHSLLHLMCKASSLHKWAAAADFFFEAFMQAYNFQEAHPDVDALTGSWDYETLVFGIPDDLLAGVDPDEQRPTAPNSDGSEEDDDE